MYLEAERVFLRDFRDEDVSPFERYHADERYLRFYAAEAGEPMHARALVKMFMEAARASPRRDFTLAIVERAGCELIGCCSLRTAGKPARRADFGLELAPSWWGRGLAAESARALLEFGFDSLTLNEVHGQSVSENRRVARLVARLGFARMPDRPGSAWMRERGWTFAEWLLTKEAWAARLDYLQS